MNLNLAAYVQEWWQMIFWPDLVTPTHFRGDWKFNFVGGLRPLAPSSGVVMKSLLAKNAPLVMSLLANICLSVANASIAPAYAFFTLISEPLWIAQIDGRDPLILNTPVKPIPLLPVPRQPSRWLAKWNQSMRKIFWAPRIEIWNSLQRWKI